MKSASLFAGILASVSIAALAGPLAPGALADGDPASDILIVQRVFYPYYSNTPKDELKALQKTVDAATAAGYPIRVAVITSPYDLGTLSALWHKPQAYSRFLSLEISFAYKRRLLVVTPNGFGYVDRSRPDQATLALLRTVEIEKGTDGLLRTADRAVRRLAGASGYKLPAAERSSGSSMTRDILLIVAAAVALALLSVGVHRLRRGRRRRPSEDMSP